MGRSSSERLVKIWTIARQRQSAPKIRANGDASLLLGVTQRGQIRAKVERHCLSYEEGSKKAKMPADKAWKLATDNWTRKQERLGAITIPAKGVESDASRIDHH